MNQMHLFKAMYSLLLRNKILDKCDNHLDEIRESMRKTRLTRCI